MYVSIFPGSVSQRCKHIEIGGDKKGKGTYVPSKINGMPWLLNASLSCLMTCEGAASFFFLYRLVRHITIRKKFITLHKLLI
jgi:hypothetical protein